jgi:hypothetical protein
MSEEIRYRFEIEIPDGTPYTTVEKEKLLSMNSHPDVVNCTTRDEVKALVLKVTGVVYYVPGYVVKRIPINT